MKGSKLPDAGPQPKRYRGRPEAETASAAPYLAFGQLFRTHTGYLSDKWMQYLTVYERELRSMIARHEPLRLLEIGVQNGGSLQIWHKYLPKGSQITGIDIDPRCAKLSFPRGVRVFTGDAGDANILKNLLADENFDIIVDDGSHRQQDVINSFKSLIPRLSAGGKYFIEDMHTSYWAELGGGFRSKTTSVEFVKDLVDGLNLDHTNSQICEEHRRLLADVNQEVCQISFYDSIAIIEKYLKPKISRFARVVTGDQTHVTGASVIADEVVRNPDGFELLGSSSKAIMGAALLSAQQAVAEHSAALQAARSELAQSRAELEAREAECGEAVRQAEALDAMLRVRDSELVAAQAEAAARAAALQQAGQQISERDAASAMLQNELAERVAALQQAGQQITERDAASAMLQTELAAVRTALAQAEDQVNQREAAIDGLRRSVASLEHEAEKRAAATAVMQAELASVSDALAAARQVGRSLLAALRTGPVLAPATDQLLRQPRGIFRLIRHWTGRARR
jgi:cephalosporin hydroxylase